jgi:hypothetical protein
LTAALTRKLQVPMNAAESGSAKKPVSLERWLSEKQKASTQLMALGAAGLFAASALTLFITYWVLYILFALLFAQVMFDFAVGLWAPFVGLAVLFGLHAIVRQQELEDYKFEGGSRQTMALVAARATGMGMLALAAGPDTVMSFGKLALSILLIGPATFSAGVRLVMRAWRVSRMNVEACAPLLATLYSADRKFPFEELVKLHPNQHPQESLPQLADLGGVIFRTSDPPGLSLSAELREEIRGRKKKKAAESPSA